MPRVPTRSRRKKENPVASVSHLFSVAAQYVDHPDVQDVYRDEPSRLASASQQLREAVELVRDLPDHAVIANKTIVASFSYTAQEVADLLSDPRVTRIHFALPASNIVRALRNMVAALKPWRR